MENKRTFLGCECLECSCKDQEDLLDEWAMAFDAQMVKAKAFLRNRGLDEEPDRMVRVERAENMAAEDLLPGGRS